MSTEGIPSQEKNRVPQSYLGQSWEVLTSSVKSPGGKKSLKIGAAALLGLSTGACNGNPVGQLGKELVGALQKSAEIIVEDGRGQAQYSRTTSSYQYNSSGGASLQAGIGAGGPFVSERGGYSASSYATGRAAEQDSDSQRGRDQDNHGLNRKRNK